VRRALLLLALAGVPAPAFAHDAFGDLGPFYAAFLHPLADPAQGLLLAAAALCLARQPLGIVRPAYAALAAGGLAALVFGLMVALPVPGLRVMTVLALVLALAALVRPRAGAGVAVALAGGVGVLAALPLDAGADGRVAMLTALGGAAGIALAALLVWGLADLANRRLSPVSSLVAAAWVAAIALMAAVLPMSGLPA
jgi:hypothetical protein